MQVTRVSQKFSCNISWRVALVVLQRSIPASKANSLLHGSPPALMNDFKPSPRFTFFLHFRPDFLIEALPGTVPQGEEPQWPPITAHDYLQERLREIKLA